MDLRVVLSTVPNIAEPVIGNVHLNRSGGIVRLHIIQTAIPSDPKSPVAAFVAEPCA